MAAGHDHKLGASTGAKHSRRLALALGLTGSFLIAEVIGGLLTGSLALLSDAAHMFTDAAALAVALVAIRIAQRPADRTRTFGYYRFEILAAAFNAVVLFLVAFYILYEAYRRLFEPTEIQTIGMLLVALGGLIVNTISFSLLRAGSEESLNVKGAYLEVLADLLGSVAVIAGALLIRFTGWAWIDPVLAALIGLWVLPRTWTLLSQSLNILLEGVPREVDLAKLNAELLALPGVEEVHDLHVWAITSGQNSLSAHLVTPAPTPELLEAAQQVTARHGVGHTTFQLDTPERARRERESASVHTALDAKER